MCLSAGMDDYISKRFKTRGLVKALERDTGRNIKSCVPAKVIAVDAETTIKDEAAINRLKSVLGQKAAVMQPRLIEDFKQQSGKFLEQAPRWIAENNCEELRRTAHTDKSNAKYFGAIQLAELCQEMENQANRDRLEGFSKYLDRMNAQWPEVLAALVKYRDGSEG